ncbi:methyltransferase domain-containing protein [Ethanoligenens harbinense]|uniref:Trans-aconitate 2-methyltransferase n=1 Tax=Ethanoligenens harbinense (strain DSM 18485 / JCM 12961 / CGMCC 1.5033 / YUAN-3) TaxID=663278 RepID=E6U7G0_ETHHY|nr:methyltransferase domain-containing protein [Ethanoligenens harbinense]ADU26983.1 Trans-aconitate 2-methyltransferase [Ethanoligenens harbinense YUAN-3]AVQ96072.1 methyltransferase domain-containing protein [Ethanoligenens harbinense YUAN-3]AYF38733.1 methyltransferase domain-containing protein [Ethanoligenens harbinense]AYF41480.1 methyltransferase domain-containing protein [Ethanoligenens harbinense]QCN92313.1 methyltransferase domain-containing protein [Ethanoligenens harbinense]
MRWDSNQYLKFERERTQPSIDLTEHIRLQDVRRVLDIGCGPGNSTRVLKDRFPQADILGIDRSAEMVEAARKMHPDLRFGVLDAGSQLGDLTPGFDVVFSNACIQWIPDHPRLLREMLGLLRPGGVLAVQTPMNYEEPIHQIITETVMRADWKDAFPQPRVFYNLEQNAYVDLLTELSAAFTVWQTTYFHILPNHAAILEWYRGTGLRPYLSTLPKECIPAFEQEIFAQIVARYPKQKNGEVIFRFPRFFFTATAR